jgi:hypothetical protein
VVARMKGRQQGRNTNSGRDRGMGVRANAAQAIIGRTVEAGNLKSHDRKFKIASGFEGCTGMSCRIS